jgi:Protein of unknown function (DUF3140)
MSDDNDDTRKEFDEAVNMTAGELEKWLGTDESRSVGQKSGSSGESTGHESGRRIVKILKAKKSDLSDDDYAHMRKVAGYTKRHLAQRPSGDVKDSAWRYSLMNWGHDPVKSRG